MKGTRVQSIIRELRGEKIDIVEWSDDPSTFVLNALSPAKVSRVSVVDEEQRIMEVVVEDKQLSLAIGKKGQNVRLAAKIVGWRSTSRARKRSAARSRRRWRAWRERWTRSAAWSATASARRRSRSSSRRASTASPTCSRCPTTSWWRSRDSAEDGRQDPRGRDAGEAGVGRPRRRRGSGEGGGGAGAGRAGCRRRRGRSRGGGRVGGGVGVGAGRRRLRSRGGNQRRPERRGGWDGWGTLGSSRSPET